MDVEYTSSIGNNNREEDCCSSGACNNNSDSGRCSDNQKMPPSATTSIESDSGETDSDLGVSLLELASNEIECMRNIDKNTDNNSNNDRTYHSFPTACLSLLKHLEGNHRCVDCGDHNPQWAAVKYGALVCLQCSGQHRSLGVQVSTVRSITMDEWSLQEVLSMLEGGNNQLLGFFARHALTEDAVSNTKATTITKENVTKLRYKTKAALFYRRNMELHVVNVLNAGPYRGREISRRLKHHQLEKRNSNIY